VKPSGSFLPARKAAHGPQANVAEHLISEQHRRTYFWFPEQIFPAVMPMSPNHGMKTALPAWSIRTVMYFDPDTVALLRTTLDRAWASLSPRQQAVTSRSVLAERILKAAARGERDRAFRHCRRGPILKVAS
jgi:hypothetical protein